jgi:hypothetical protein
MRGLRIAGGILSGSVEGSDASSESICIILGNRFSITIRLHVVTRALFAFEVRFRFFLWQTGV